MRILALVTDAFGSRGGIAKFNRDLLAALCAASGVERVVAIPRLLVESPGRMPANLDFATAGAGGKVRFVFAVIKAALCQRNSAFLVCGHINLLGLAFVARFFLCRLPSGQRPPILLIIHGIDAWQPTRSGWVNRLVRKVEVVVAVSEFSRQKFWNWAKPATAVSFIVPNCVDLTQFTPGPKRPELVKQYGLQDRTVLLTVARLSAVERYKGIDQVLEALPTLLKKIPNLLYLVVGDGTDRERLQKKAAILGLSDQVVFTGHVPEMEKVDHYRLADVFIMPGWGEGFGIVYLEAMGCGIPVVASKLDASQEAVLNGRIGTLVDPHNPGELINGTLTALRSPRGVPAGLEYFSQEQFNHRINQLVTEVGSS